MGSLFGVVWQVATIEQEAILQPFQKAMLKASRDRISHKYSNMINDNITL